VNTRHLPKRKMATRVVWPRLLYNVTDDSLQLFLPDPLPTPSQTLAMCPRSRILVPSAKQHHFRCPAGEGPVSRPFFCYCACVFSLSFPPPPTDVHSLLVDVNKYHPFCAVSLHIRSTPSSQLLRSTHPLRKPRSDEHTTAVWRGANSY
jgi:hypothetical protein